MDQRLQALGKEIKVRATSQSTKRTTGKVQMEGGRHVISLFLLRPPLLRKAEQRLDESHFVTASGVYKAEGIPAWLPRGRARPPVLCRRRRHLLPGSSLQRCVP